MFQTALKVPSEPTVAETVEAHVQFVSWPERSISIVSPARLCGAVPEKLSPLRSMAEARVCSVMPFPLVLTVVFPLCGAVTPVGDDVGWGDVVPDPPGLTLPPPDDASPLAGRASALHSSTQTA